MSAYAAAKPLLCNDTTVRAILAGRQTQDRRPATQWIGRGGAIDVGSRFPCGEPYVYRPDHCCPACGSPSVEWLLREDEYGDFRPALGPHGEPGDLLYVRPPRWAARTWLRVKRVWVERVQDISEADAVAEGCHAGPVLFSGGVGLESARNSFVRLWDSIYAGRGDGWDANPYVFCCEFELTEAPK